MTTEPETASPPLAPADERPALPWRAITLVAGTVLAASAALGALGGWLWYSWWAPAAPGRIYETTSGLRWYPDPWDPGQHQVFVGTGGYALVGLAAGVLLGIVAAVVGWRQPYAALAALVVGSALAAYVAFLVGTALSPPDPQAYATAEHIGDEYPAAISVTGWTSYLSWPLAALVAFCVAIVIGQGVRTTRTKLDALPPLPSAKDGRSEQSPLP